MGLDQWLDAEGVLEGLTFRKNYIIHNLAIEHGKREGENVWRLDYQGLLAVYDSLQLLRRHIEFGRAVDDLVYLHKMCGYIGEFAGKVREDAAITYFINY